MPSLDTVAWFVKALAGGVPGLSELVQVETTVQQEQRKARLAGRVARAFHLGDVSEPELDFDSDDDWDDDYLLPETEITRPARKAVCDAATRSAGPRALRMAMRTETTKAPEVGKRA